MERELRIRFRGIERSDAVEERIRRRLAELEHRHPGQIEGWDVLVDAPHHRGSHGMLYAVHLEIHLRGRVVRVTQGEDGHAHDDVYVAIRDAFDAVDRQLEPHGSRRRDGAKAAMN